MKEELRSVPRSEWENPDWENSEEGWTWHVSFNLKQAWGSLPDEVKQLIADNMLESFIADKYYEALDAKWRNEIACQRNSVADAAKSFMDLFIVENGDERWLSVEDVDHAKLCERFSALESTLDFPRAN